MKFTSAFPLALLASIARAAITDYELSSDSSDSSVNGLALVPYHEGAAINYFFLNGTTSTPLPYDDSTQLFNGPPDYGSIADGYHFGIIESNHVAALSVAATNPVTFIDGYLAINGSSSGFYAAKNIQEPYEYSQTTYAVVYYPDNDAPEGAIAIKIKATATDSTSSSSSAAASSSAPATTAVQSTSAAETTSAASSSAPHVSTANGAGAKVVSGGLVGAALLGLFA